MSRDGGVGKYTRQDLRKATRFVEGDYTGINPREFYRRLKRRLEEFQTANDFKYETYGSQQSDLEILSEDVGSKTGRLDGRLVAESDWELLGEGTLEYRPYGPHGALAIVVGLLVGLVAGLAEALLVAVLGVLVAVGGGYLYFQTERGSFPLVRKDIVRTLMTGEVSERTISEDDERRTDIFANMSAIYAGDTFVNVHVDGVLPGVTRDVQTFEDMPWPLRRAVVTQVRKWHNDIVVEEQRLDISEGFLDHLTAWSNRSLDADRTTVRRIQEDINGSFDVRLSYTEVLLDSLGTDVASDIEAQQEEIAAELNDLAEDMDVYVEREGLTHTSED